MPRKRTNIPANYGAALPTQLRELMRSSGYTQTDLAGYLGITRQSVSAYMDGSANPTPSTIVSIAKFFDVSTDFLLGETTYRKKEVAQLTAEDMGLSEDAAFILKSENHQENKAKLIVLNYLIRHPLFWEKITSYFAFSTEKVAQSRPYSLLPYEKRNMDARLFFADIIQNLQKFKDDFFDSIESDRHSVKQMVFALASEYVDHKTAEKWCQLLYDCRDDPGEDEQLSMIAQFLRFYGYSDNMHRLDYDLERFILCEKEEVE